MFGPRVRPVALVLLLVPSSFAASATHVVSGVAASRPYHVSVNGTNAGTATSDATGVLALAGVGPGVVHLTSAAGADVIPPAPITDLALTGEAPAGLELRFRAVGDDGILGRASAYELRWASGYSGMLLAPLVEVLPLTPSPAGTEEVLLVPDPMPGRLLLLGLRVRDDAGNWSAPSNVVVRAADGEGEAPADTIPPAPVTDLAIDGVEPGAFRLSWTASGDDGTTGTAHHVELRWSRSMSGLLLAPNVVPNPPAPAPAGTHETFLLTGLPEDAVVYVLCLVVDEAGLLSPFSNVVGARTPPGATAEGEALDGLGLRVDPDFDVADLNEAQRLWYERLQVSIAASFADVEAYAETRDLYRLARTVGNYNASLLNALRATGDGAFLDRVALLSDRMAATLADAWLDGTEDGYDNWVYLAEPGSVHYGRDTIELEEALMHGNVALLAYAFHVNRDLDPAYAARADFWRTYLEETFLAKWTERAGGRLAAWESGGGFYKRLVHARANQLRLAYYLERVTGDSFYADRVLHIASELNAHLEDNPAYPGAVRWKHQVSGGDLGWQKVGYAHTFIRVATELHVDRGTVFDATSTMRALATTIRDAVYGPHDPASGRMSERVDGSGIDGAEPYGLLLLSRWDDSGALAQVAERLQGTGQSGVWNASAMLLAVTSERSAPDPRWGIPAPDGAVLSVPPPVVSVSPNPVRDAAEIRLVVPDADGDAVRTRADVFDVRGRRVARLLDEPRTGAFELSWRPGTGIGAGMYFLRIRSGSRAWTHRVTVLR